MSFQPRHLYYYPGSEEPVPQPLSPEPSTTEDSTEDLAALFAICLVLLGILVTTVVGVLVFSERSRPSTTKSPSPSLSVPESSPSSPNISAPLACVAHGCVATTSMLISIMNNSIEPCSEFYGFVCGNYKDKHNQVLSSMTAELLQNVEKMLKDIKVPPHGQTPTEKAAGLYQACLGVEEKAPDSVVSLRRFFKSIDAPAFESTPGNVLDTIIRLSLTYNMPTLLRLTLEDAAVHKGKKELRIVLNMQELAVIQQTRKALKTQKDTANFYFRHLDAYGSQGTALALDVIRVENKALSAFTQDIALNLSTLHYADINELDSYTPHVPPGRWESLISHYSGSIYGTTDGVLISPGALKYFDVLYTDLQEIELGLLTSWLLLRRMAAFTLPEVRNMYAEKYVKHLCFSEVLRTMEMPSVAMYLFKLVPATAEAASKAMLENIRSSILDEISTSSWLEPLPKSVAHQKVRVMQDHVGFPKHLSSDTALAARYHLYPDVGANFVDPWLLTSQMNAQWSFKDQANFNFLVHEANAYYAPRRNTMIIPAGIMRPPVFINQGPASFNYGGLGHVLSHEIMHAFDVSGSKRDETGQLRNWWTPKTHRQYVDKALCLRRSHQKFVQRRRSTEELNSTLDSENMADFIGLLSAHEAFRSLGDKRVLDGLPYNAEQLFFIASCVKWCSTSELKRGDRYATSRARCNVPLMNLKEFADGFHCRTGDAMNPPHRCTFWK